MGQVERLYCLILRLKETAVLFPPQVWSLCSSHNLFLKLFLKLDILSSLNLSFFLITSTSSLFFTNYPIFKTQASLSLDIESWIQHQRAGLSSTHRNNAQNPSTP